MTEFGQMEGSTIAHYDQNAVSFFNGTIDHDVSQNYRAFLEALPQNNPLEILDFGCGPGRDLKYFSELGHCPTGLDGSVKFCDMAREYSQCDVLHQSFLSLDLPAGKFDGVFANASLFHVPAAKLGNVLIKLYNSLRESGILFMSNPRGNGEAWSGQRYGHYMEYHVIEDYLQEANFEPLSHYYRPEGQPRTQQPWLAVVSRRL